MVDAEESLSGGRRGESQWWTPRRVSVVDTEESLSGGHRGESQWWTPRSLSGGHRGVSVVDTEESRHTEQTNKLN